MTLRDLMEMIHLKEDSCADCHKYMDPLAFPLENYDAIGAFRTVEPNGLPINPVVEDEIYGVLENGADLAASVAMDPRLTNCLVNNLIRFGRGRLEDPQNEPDELLDELEKGYLERVMRRSEGNISEAARLSRIHRTYLLEMLKRAGMHNT